MEEIQAYLQIKKQHSEKKKKDYIGSYLVFNGMEYMINLNDTIQSILLNKTMREIALLPVGYESPKFPLNINVD